MYLKSLKKNLTLNEILKHFYKNCYLPYKYIEDRPTNWVVGEERKNLNKELEKIGLKIKKEFKKDCIFLLKNQEDFFNCLVTRTLAISGDVDKFNFVDYAKKVYEREEKEKEMLGINRKIILNTDKKKMDWDILRKEYEAKIMKDKYQKLLYYKKQIDLEYRTKINPKPHYWQCRINKILNKIIVDKKDYYANVIYDPSLNTFEVQKTVTWPSKIDIDPDTDEVYGVVFKNNKYSVWVNAYRPEVIYEAYEIIKEFINSRMLSGQLKSSLK